jgi:hypothetical protein
VPQTKDLNLFFLNHFGEVEGKIKNNLPGFINWILSCPREYLESLQAGGEVLSKFINPDNIIGSHHLEAWIESSLINEGKSPIGNNKSGNDTLYGNYLKWCHVNNIDPCIKINRFSELLLDNLISLNWKGISKKRTSSGYFLIGVKIRTEEVLIPATLETNNIISLGKNTDILNFCN